MKRIFYIFKTAFLILELSFLLMIGANMWVYSLIDGRSYDKISRTPPRETALVLGTSPKMKSGDGNPYFISRMDAVALLYHHGKIKKIIVSGEKSPGYDEPAAMKNYLMYQEGVPEEIITEDPKGFNTHASILRCKNVYKSKNIIIVTQGFHNIRSLFFARNNNLNAIGFNAAEINKPESFYRNQFREFLARNLAVFYYLTGFSPD